MKISPVHISNFMADGGAMFGVIPRILWSKRYQADENNFLNLSIRALIVDNGENVILVDTGYGNKQDERFLRNMGVNGGDGLLDGIRKAGYQPSDITDVFHTHLHADHCGGSIVRDEAGELVYTFQGARYWVSRRQWEWALKSNLREAAAYPGENIEALDKGGDLRLVEEEGELFNGFSVRMVNGHTPGQLIPVIDYKGTRLVFSADLFPTIAHIPLLWNMAYDLDQLATIEEKERILRESLENNYILFFEHDLHVECCTLTDTPKGIREDRVFRFSDI